MSKLLTVSTEHHIIFLSAYLHLPLDPGDPGPHPIFALTPLCDLRLVPSPWPQVPHPFLVLTLLPWL